MTHSKTEKCLDSDGSHVSIEKEYTYIQVTNPVTMRSEWVQMLISAERTRHYPDGRVEPMPFKPGEIVEP